MARSNVIEKHKATTLNSYSIQFSLAKMILKVSSLLILLLALANAANILILSALPSFSHHKW